MNHIIRGVKIDGTNTNAQLTGCRQPGPAPQHHRVHGEGCGHFELAPFFLSDVQNVHVVHCKESVTGFQIKTDVISEDQPESIFPNLSFTDVIVSHTGAKQQTLVRLTDQVVQAGQTAAALIAH